MYLKNHINPDGGKREARAEALAKCVVDSMVCLNRFRRLSTLMHFVSYQAGDRNICICKYMYIIP